MYETNSLWVSSKSLEISTIRCLTTKKSISLGGLYSSLISGEEVVVEEIKEEELEEFFLTTPPH